MNERLSDPPHHQIADAIRDNKVSALGDLLKAYPEHIDNEMFDGWLHYAAREGRLEIVKYLIANGFDVNGKENFDGVAPLESACSGGHYQIVRFLLNHGAKIDVSTSVRNPLFAVIIESIQDTMNKTWGPPTGEAPAIARLLLERGLDSKVRYKTRTMKNMDALAFAMMMGAHELAHVIAMWNADGDEAKAQLLIAVADSIAEANTKPVPPGEQIAPS